MTKRRFAASTAHQNPKQNLFALSVSERRTDAPGLLLAKHRFMHEELFFLKPSARLFQWFRNKQSESAERTAVRHYVIHKTSLTAP